MSSAPKRPHEEVGHSSSSKYGHEDTVAGYPKLSSSGASTDFHHPTYEMGQDARVVKIPRNESRDSDRRSPLHSIYRMPSTSSHDAHIDTHQPAAESRLESRDSKDIPRIEARELYGEVKRDENKEVKNDRESYSDLRSDTKTEKDGFGVSGGHLNWKDSKEYLRGKRYSDAPSGTMDPWHMPRGNVHGLVEVGKDSSATEERDHVEAHEAIGENRVDLKAEERFKEKDRKRKDIKHRDWGDRDKERGERRSILQGDYKELAKEEKESEKGERDRKDISKDKEKLRDREKDHMKRESWSGVEKEGLHNEKEIGDGSGRVSQPDLENSASEQKKQKEFDGWKNVDRDVRDRRRERDADLEGDRPEKRPRSYDKESDDGGTDLEGAAERERDAFGYGVQQRKRMLRPRGSPQVGNRELRLRPRTQENEGSPGKSEVSSVIYEVGECMQELVKLWKEYEASQAEKDGDSSNCGPTLEVRIPAEHVTATNRQVRGGQLWGTDIYTDDSDLVAVLMHTGYCRPTASPPPPAIQELRATIRVLPPQDCYKSEQRNNVRSRAWGAGSGCSYRIERCCIVKKGGGTIDLEPCLTHSATVEPTLAPVAVERTMTTRAAASNALRQQRFVREVTIQYNLCNEPWVKYSISIVADKGLKKPLYTSARLKKGEVLYLETHSCRYELCFNGEKMVKAQLHDAETDKPQNHHTHASNGEKNDGENIMIDGFRWSRCKKPLPQKVMRSIGIPLPLEHVEVLEENIDWEDVQWSQTGVWITGKEYNLARVHFLSMN